MMATTSNTFGREGVHGINRDMSQFNMDAYLKRVGINLERSSSEENGRRVLRPDLDTLKFILEHHTRAIPFENLDILQGKPIALDTESIMQKLVLNENGRGGYCFEQNLLLSHVLEHIGYNVRHVGGRVRWYFDSRKAIPPRTHLFLLVNDLVTTGDCWLADAGPVPNHATPMPFEIDKEVTTTHDIRRIVKEEDDEQGVRYFIQVKTGAADDAWKDSVEFTTNTFHPIDIEVANWFTSSCPLSHFSVKLIVARCGYEDNQEEGLGSRVYIAEGVLTVRRKDGKVIKSIPITNYDHLIELLIKYFGIKLSPDAALGPPGATWSNLNHQKRIAIGSN